MMTLPDWLDVRQEVAAALRDGRPVVALESTVIAHGLPRPRNLDVALAVEKVVREEGAVPATIGVWQGRPIVGLDAQEIEAMATRDGIRKAGRRDLAAAVAQQAHAATTVSGTMFLAHAAGIRVFATGGIGGVHPGDGSDVSADLTELGRTPVAVVCAGAKSLLDLRRTLEVLETLGVPVVGYGTDLFAAFYLRSSGEPVSARVNTPGEAAALVAAHWHMGGAGVVLAQPVAEAVALEPEDFGRKLAEAEEEARSVGIRGPEVTPFVLAALARLTGGQSLRANEALLLANARLAARVAGEWTRLRQTVSGTA